MRDFFNPSGELNSGAAEDFWGNSNRFEKTIATGIACRDDPSV